MVASAPPARARPLGRFMRQRAIGIQLTFLRGGRERESERDDGDKEARTRTVRSAVVFVFELVHGGDENVSSPLPFRHDV